ncbi:MAG TPA: hypothetical protein DIU20_14635 [Cryomorphaceae bacterium]|nr:hypothetical protein [Owenweeksia sp.]HCQ17502.1 hypothetical protein [Cryomorphaceae bacterium]|tara:strand:- start:13390 stop:17505 length:4116 start_codon:yes stop_codon:yes gene_type:complete
MKVKNLILAFLMVCGVLSLSAREYPPKNSNNQKKAAMKALAEDCQASISDQDLSINNVRARILGSGDMWWDLDNARYEVPKGSGKHSMFAGSLWLGGLDQAGQLKLAAMTYRTRGVDFWPGPLDDQASIDASTCRDYDRHWLIYKDQVDIHRQWLECKTNPDCDAGDRFPGYEGNVPLVIRDWPGNGPEGNKLAPFFEVDSSGTPGAYEWQYDYPGYYFGTETPECQSKETDLLYGDETIWWVYNDKGNKHTETQAGALGFEIRAQAFAFASNDEINNMTFNNYRIINKSTFKLDSTYFGTWFDPDLGNSDDDIIGCDIARGLGYCYNAKSNDSGPRGYGLNPPAVGFDFFQGPFADYNDGIDNDRDGCVDGVKRGDSCVAENPNLGINERIIMSGFMYYNRTGSGGVANTSDPTVAAEFYNYLRVTWKNGNNLVIESPSGKGITTNGDGYTADGSGDKTFFAYPGLSYDTTGAYEPSQPIANGGWWESPDNDADKRGLHSAGPFSLAPGALNFITTGVVWARNFNSSDLFASVNDVILADDKAQQLFDNCFEILEGPTTGSPVEIEIVELDRELIFKIKNAFNPATIGYDQIDPRIAVPKDSAGNDLWNAAQVDSATKAGYFSYRFEGFQIFQVNGPDIALDEIYNTQQSRLVAQSDLKNDVGQLVNFVLDQDLENGALVPQDMTVEANNNGIELTYRFTEDAFAQGDRRLVNHKEYYYYVIAYAQNQFVEADPRNLSAPSQKEPFLAGRKVGNGQKPYLAIPSKIQSRNGGTTLNSAYGDEVGITRLDGAGNSGNFLRIAEESEESIVFNKVNNEIKYLVGSGPFDVKVIDPYNVKGGTYKLTFSDATANANWTLTNVAGDEVYAESEYDISFLGEQIIDELGISLTFTNQPRPGSGDPDGTFNNGVIGGEIVFDNPGEPWLTGVEDDDSETPKNWILAGTQGFSASSRSPYDDYKFPNTNPTRSDPQGAFETFLNGTWAPAAYASSEAYNPNNPNSGRPLRTGNFGNMYPVSDIGNVDIVITRDQSKWTRCPVIELGVVAESNDGGKANFTLRSGTTMDKDGNGGLVPNPNNPEAATGWSYFPGYAINVETGRRLCMAFGESSWLKSENGGDMIWNPSPNEQRLLNGWALGGMHAVYVFADSIQLRSTDPAIDMTYKNDSISAFPLLEDLNQMDQGKVRNQQTVFGSMYWIGLPMVSSPEYVFESYSDIPTDAKVSLRMGKPYQKTGFNEEVEIDRPNNGIPQYLFSTDGYIPETGVMEVANKALDLIKVVPNPYNGSSQYEDSQLDNIVKITNLPGNCKISIFMTNGTLIRTINKANDLTYVEWDLKNDFNVPIASGIYLIHVDAGPVGEKVIKWMGTMRPVDLNAF